MDSSPQGSSVPGISQAKALASAARGGTVSIVSWAVVGGVQKVKSKTRREERETSYYCDLCGGWENGALGPEQVSSSLSLSV